MNNPKTCTKISYEFSKLRSIFIIVTKVPLNTPVMNFKLCKYRNTIAGSPVGERIIFFQKKVHLSKIEFLDFFSKKISNNDLK